MLSENARVSLSIQRALLDVVTPSLRRVSFTVSNHLIVVCFFYDEQVREFEQELVDDAVAEIISDFPNTYDIKCQITVVKSPKRIFSEGQIVFNRYEPNP